MARRGGANGDKMLTVKAFYGPNVAKLRPARLPNGEIFYSLKEAQIVIEQWRKHYNTI
jgi:hypothetical protein